MVGLIKAPEKFQNSLGFLFLGGSFVKFIFFFSVFYGDFTADGRIERLEFFTFFVPYSAALVMETKTLIHKLSQ